MAGEDDLETQFGNIQRPDDFEQFVQKYNQEENDKFIRDFKNVDDDIFLVLHKAISVAKKQNPTEYKDKVRDIVKSFGAPENKVKNLRKNSKQIDDDDIFEAIDKAIAVAASEFPASFMKRITSLLKKYEETSKRNKGKGKREVGTASPEGRTRVSTVEGQSLVGRTEEGRQAPKKLKRVDASKYFLDK